MIFLPINQISSGMVLAKDLMIRDTDRARCIMLKAGQRLTDLFISRLRALGVVGAYISDGSSNDIDASETINDELKCEAVTGIRTLYEKFAGNPDRVTNKNIDDLGNIADKLISTIEQNSEFMINIIDLKMYDDYTYHHSLSVAVLATAIGISLEFSNQLLYDLCLAAMLHDIGKVAIPIEIINKPGPLTRREFDIIKDHPMNAGLHLLQKRLISKNTYYGIISHHERYNGSGYPLGLKGEDIPLFGRILAVADVYDALTSNRSYRKPCLPSEAIEYIMGGIGIYFDENIVKLFLKKVAPYPVGTLVSLSNGLSGIVTHNHEVQPLRPTIRVISSNEEIDLCHDMRYTSVVITGLLYT